MSKHDQRADSILAEMRHTQCDCMIEIVHTGDDDDRTDTADAAPTTILAHRAILARASYFLALFQHNDPTRILHRDDQGRRVVRSVYRIRLPPTLNIDAVRSVVECLYHGRGSTRPGEQDIDPIDRVEAILFLGAPAHYIPKLVRSVIHTLMHDIALAKEAADRHYDRPLDGVIDTHDPETKREDEANARLRLAWFVRRVADSDMPLAIKTNLLAYTLYALPDTERDQISDCHHQLVAGLRAYRPEARVGDAHTDGQGRRWRMLHLAFGCVGLAPALAATITWQDLDFTVAARFVDHEEGESFMIYAQCRPHDEALGPMADATGGKPVGLIDVERRAAVFALRTYHPVDDARIESFNGGFALDDCARRPGLPKGAISVPHALVMGCSLYSKPRRSRSSHCVYGLGYANRKRRDLLACEVDILVEEL
nr:BTB incomplete domain containing protein [Pandoravirus aubagnensis]